MSNDQQPIVQVSSITFHQRKFCLSVCLSVTHHIPFVHFIMERDLKSDPPSGPHYVLHIVRLSIYASRASDCLE